MNEYEPRQLPPIHNFKKRFNTLNHNNISKQVQAGVSGLLKLCLGNFLLRARAICGYGIAVRRTRDESTGRRLDMRNSRAVPCRVVVVT